MPEGAAASRQSVIMISKRDEPNNSIPLPAVLPPDKRAAVLADMEDGDGDDAGEVGLEAIVEDVTIEDEFLTDVEKILQVQLFIYYRVVFWSLKSYFYL